MELGMYLSGRALEGEKKNPNNDRLKTGTGAALL
jgi:hypothetical protein